MKFTIVFLALCISYAASFVVQDPVLREAWESFKNEHGKTYDNIRDELKRFNVWKSNSDFVTKHNTEADNGKHTFWVKMNKFADLVSLLAQYSITNSSITTFLFH
jgi:cathepsin L